MYPINIYFVGFEKKDFYEGSFEFVEKFQEVLKIFEVKKGVNVISLSASIPNTSFDSVFGDNSDTTVVFNCGTKRGYTLEYILQYFFSKNKKVRLIVLGERKYKKGETIKELIYAGNEKELLISILNIIPKLGKNGYRERGFMVPKFYICKLCNRKVKRGTGGCLFCSI